MIGPKMHAVVTFVSANPGLPMLASAEHVGPNKSRKYGYRTVHRAISAGLVWPVRDVATGRTRLYPLVK